MGRISHRTECQHPQTPAARRQCRTAKLAAVANQRSEELPAGYTAMRLRTGAWEVGGPDGFERRGRELWMLASAAQEHAVGAPKRAAAKAEAAAIAAAEAIVRQSRVDHLAALEAAHGPLATRPQVDYIMDLLVRHNGEPGFMVGPTTRAGVEEMSKVDASAYISSLTGQY